MDQPHSLPTHYDKHKEIYKPDHIPCLYLPFHMGSDKTLLYFHGNSEDLGQIFDFMAYLRSKLCVNVAAMEYPGYGIYKSKTCSEKQI